MTTDTQEPGPETFASLEVTPWFRTAEHGPPTRPGPYQTCADPARFKASGVLFRDYSGQLRWGPADSSIARCVERAKSEGYLLTAPMYYRGLTRPHHTLDNAAFERECYVAQLQAMDWGHPVPHNLAAVRKSAARIDSLSADQRRIDPTGELWNRYAPPHLQIGQPAEVVVVRQRVQLVEPVQAELPLTAPRVRLIV